MATVPDETSEQLARLWLDVLPRLMRLLSTAATVEDLDHPLSPLQFRILKGLSHGPKLGSGLAQALHITPPTVSAAIDSLVRRGLVERCEPADDRRAIPLRITSAGIHCYQAAQQRALAVLTRLVEGMPPAERDALARGLDALGEALDSHMRS